MQQAEKNSKLFEYIYFKESNKITNNFISINETKSILNKIKYRSFISDNRTLINNNKISAYYLITLNLILLISISKANIFRNINYIYSSYITLKIQGPGKKKYAI